MCGRYGAIRLTILVEDGSPVRAGLESEHGFCVLVEADGLTGLFDVGQSGAFRRNAERLGIDLHGLDWIALSHGHYDNTGGLAELPAFGRPPRLFAHSNVFERKTIREADASSQVDRPAVAGAEPKSRPADSFRYAGSPRIAADLAGTVETHLAPGVSTISPSVLLTGTVPRTVAFESVPPRFVVPRGDGWAQDTFPDDQSMLLRTSLGVVVVFGCAHAGPVNILNHVRSIASAPVVGVVGGMHLGQASPDRIAQTVQACRDYGIRWVAPCHCTGEAARDAFRQAYGDEFCSCSPGTVLEF